MAKYYQQLVDDVFFPFSQFSRQVAHGVLFHTVIELFGIRPLPETSSAP